MKYAFIPAPLAFLGVCPQAARVNVLFLMGDARRPDDGTLSLPHALQGLELLLEANRATRSKSNPPGQHRWPAAPKDCMVPFTENGH
jgi:hypothetical protein